MAGAASIAGPVQAQFNTVSTVPSRYRVEVVFCRGRIWCDLARKHAFRPRLLTVAGDAAPALPRRHLQTRMDRALP